MEYQKRLVIGVQVLAHLLGLTVSEPLLFNFCIDSGNYTKNSTYKANLNTVLSSLSLNVNTYGFYSASVGEISDRVNAIVLCRGDVPLDTCRACINNATNELVQLCPNNKEAIIWYDNCMLRYSNSLIYGHMATSNIFFMWNLNNVTSLKEFNQELRILVDDLRDKAATSGPLRKFATGNRTAPDFQTIFVLQQCTPDLSADDCKDCLMRAAGYIPECCNGKIGGRVVGPSCNLRYEVYHFFNDTLSEANTPPLNETGSFPSREVGQSPSDHRGNSSRTRIIIILAIIISISGSVMLIVCICCYRRINKPKFIDQTGTMEDISTVESMQHDFKTIKIATNYFSHSNKLGEGGFGAVYRGKLPNGQDIAVKRLSRGSGQGVLEFKNEVVLVAKLQHRNLARLLGFSIEGAERLLIYELLPNSSLDRLLFDSVRRADFDWEKRYKIIGGVAKGLLYLHEDSRLRIVHRDLKASNVLLDDQMNPKISDFGMARLFDLDETQRDTSRIVGTYGYMAPEYAMYGEFSPKSDVFSFGVLVLEIVTGQKNNHFRNGKDADDIASYTWKNWQNGTTANLIDPIIKSNSGSMRDIMRCIHIALLCVQESVTDRPTMASVLLMLNSHSIDLPVPSEPAYLMHSDQQWLLNDCKIDPILFSKSKYVSSSSNNSSITEVYPR